MALFLLYFANLITFKKRIATIDKTPSPQHNKISDYVFHHAEQSPFKEALVWQDVRINYAEFADHVKCFSKALLGSGIQRGDRVAFLGSPRPEFFISLLAAADIGAIWMGLHPRYQLDEFRHVVNQAQPKLIFAFTEIEERNYTSELQTLLDENVAVNEVVVYPQSMDSGFCKIADFLQREEKIDEQSWLENKNKVKPDDAAVIIFTSGTTGKPKGAQNSHFGLVHCAHIEWSRWPDPDMRVLQNMPINHIANIGMMSSVALVAGGTLVFQDRFDAGALLQIIEKEKISFWLQSPVQFHLAAAHENFNHTDFSSINYLIWGGGPMPLHLVEVLSQRGINLATAYGMTELTAYASYSDSNASLEELSQTIGRPESRYELRLMTQSGKLAKAGESGEIQARGRWLMNGYFNQEKETAEAFTTDGWFKTGDVAELREDGNWRLVGRTKEMYKSGGYNIYPREVEIVIESHPEVALTAVIGIGDDLYGEVGYAFVEPMAGKKVSQQALRTWCKARIANYKVPKTFEVVDALPRLPIGKIDKQSLKRHLENIKIA